MLSHFVPTDEVPFQFASCLGTFLKLLAVRRMFLSSCCLWEHFVGWLEPDKHLGLPDLTHGQSARLLEIAPCGSMHGHCGVCVASDD